MTRYALIGDVHSQPAPLADAFLHCMAHGLTPILLGDLFDSRCEFSDSASVFHMVKHAQSQFPGMVILRSNHQNKLERYIKGNPVKVYSDTQQTLDDFRKGGISLRNDILPWLSSFPYGFVFRNSRGKEFRCAHAYFPSRLEIPEYTESYAIYEAPRKVRDLMLYGKTRKNVVDDKGRPERILWWLEDANNGHTRDWVRVAGHYHHVFKDDLSIVLDGEMGGSSSKELSAEDMTLYLYDVEDFELVGFKGSW